jgi:nuclear pore complex protein Nup188
LNADDSGKEKTSAIKLFFTDPTVQHLLAHPYIAFHGPSQQTKAAFETKTSAINITPSPNTRYDIKQVKEDALWLSKEARIDELSALRIVVEEFQSRPYSQLLGRFSNEELVGIQDVIGVSQASVALLSQGTEMNTIQEDLDAQVTRRPRILRKYLSERRHLLQCVNLLTQSSLFDGPETYKDSKGKSLEVSPSWPAEIGNNLLRIGQALDQYLLESIEGIDQNIKNIDSGSGWYKDVGGREDLESEWINSQIVEATRTMEVIFMLLNGPFVCTSKVIISWLQLLTKYEFFEQFVTVCWPCKYINYR